MQILVKFLLTNYPFVKVIVQAHRGMLPPPTYEVHLGKPNHIPSNGDKVVWQGLLPSAMTTIYYFISIVFYYLKIAKDVYNILLILQFKIPSLISFSASPNFAILCIFFNLDMMRLSRNIISPKCLWNQ